MKSGPNWAELSWKLDEFRALQRRAMGRIEKRSQTLRMTSPDSDPASEPPVDRDAFGALVERYQQRVVSVARALVHNPDDAVELGQETFIRAFQNLPSFEGRSSFSTWLYRIATNLAIDWRRRETRYVISRGEDAENELRRIPSLGQG